MKREKRKILGAFYTPYEAAKTIADWAIQSATDRILEPSFGGCNFLEACRDRLTELGNNDAFENIFGCDIDNSAFTKYLLKVNGISTKLNNFIKSDFLDTTIDDYDGKKFNVIIGNPPYVGYHSMSKLQRGKSKKICLDNGIDIKGVFSLWMPFVIKSLEFLKKDGKIGFVLPNSLLDSNYAKILNSFLESKFRKITAVRISERLFVSDGTNEISVVLLCEGYKFNNSKSTSKKLVGHVSKIEDLPGFIKKNSKRHTLISISDRNNSIFSNEQLNRVFNKVESYFVLGNLFKIKIGIVTGSNVFFVIDKYTIDENSIPNSYLKFILKNGKYSPGLKISLLDFERLFDLGEKVCLISSENILEYDNNFLSYTSKLPLSEVHENRTFKKRHPWHSVKYEDIPDAFMTCMTAVGPRIIINSANVTCTNNLYRLYFKGVRAEIDLLLTSLSILSSYSQLSSELNGKNYGSGVLKLEPSATKKIRLLQYTGRKNIRSIRKLHEHVHELVRTDNVDQATSVVDLFFIDSYNGCLPDILNLLSTIRNTRYRYYGKVKN